MIKSSLKVLGIMLSAFISIQSPASISKIQYDDVLNRLDNIYRPIIERRSKGLPFTLTRKYENNEVNAHAGKLKDKWDIIAKGGFAKHPLATKDSFALIICHEIGHLVGGLPTVVPEWYNSNFKPKNSAEGQADYFASAKCMKKYLSVENNKVIVSSMYIPSIIKDSCDNIYGTTTEESAVCQRSIIAGEVQAKLLADLKIKEGITDITMSKVAVDTPDQLIVDKTNIAGYPSVQCRLDSYIAGALCNIDHRIDPTEKQILSPSQVNLPDFIKLKVNLKHPTISDFNKGYCSKLDGYRVGNRPSCWYDPMDEFMIMPFGNGY